MRETENKGWKSNGYKTASGIVTAQDKKETVMSAQQVSQNRKRYEISRDISSFNPSCDRFQNRKRYEIFKIFQRP